MKRYDANDPETKSPDFVAENVAKLSCLRPHHETHDDQG